MSLSCPGRVSTSTPHLSPRARALLRPEGCDDAMITIELTPSAVVVVGVVSTLVGLWMRLRYRHLTIRQLADSATQVTVHEQESAQSRLSVTSTRGVAELDRQEN